MTLSFGARIFLLLLLIGGAVAYIGDYIGRKIGRRRLTIFNLRPRYTAIAITVFSGIVIAATTLLTLLMMSQNTRTALFGLEELKADLNTTRHELAARSAELQKVDQELTKGQAELARAKQGLTKLRQTKKNLEQAVETSRKGDVYFGVDDLILISLIQAGPEEDKLAAGLQEIIDAAQPYLISVPPKETRRVIGELSRRSGEQIIMVFAASNALAGEEIPVRLEIRANELIYKGDAEIAAAAIPTRLSQPQIEQKIKNLLLVVHQQAKQAGVIADPAGSVGSLPYSEIYDLAKKIKSSKQNVKLQVLAKNDISALGPLIIKFRILYQ